MNMESLARMLLPYTYYDGGLRDYSRYVRHSLLDYTGNQCGLIEKRMHYIYSASGNVGCWYLVLDHQSVRQQPGPMTKEEAQRTLDALLISNGYKLLTQDDAEKYLLLL